MTHGTSAHEVLADWPDGRPIGLLVLSTLDAAGWAERVSNDPAVTHWWDCEAEDMFSGPTLEAPFRRALMLELGDATNAGALVQDLANREESGATTILCGSPMPKLARRIMGAVSGLLGMLPEPRVPDGAPALDAPRAASGVNPSALQIERFLERPSHQPVMVVNLNLHKREGTNPDSGEVESGRAIADNYFRRGIRTFSRLGARAVWAGSCRGALIDELAVGPFDQIGLIRYPSRAHFERLLRIGGAEGWERYREAGLERSWVIHCRVRAASDGAG